MAEKLTFAFPVTVLTQDGDLILTAAEKYAAQINPRLPANHVTGARTLLKSVGEQNARQKSDAGDLGTLTKEQNEKLDLLQQLISDARETAKKAFRSQDVKLHEEFQVGINKPSDLGAILSRARIILASLQKPANVDALKAKGWLDSNTTEFATAIDALDTTDNVQEAAKSTGATDARNRTANQLYDALVAIQNAANLQWPERLAGNGAVRAEFRIGKFPPRSSGPDKKPEPPQPPTTPT